MTYIYSSDPNIAWLEKQRGTDPDAIEVNVSIWVRFPNFISFEQAAELGEDAGELAGIKEAFRDFVKAEGGILQALQNGEILDSEWDVEPRCP